MEITLLYDIVIIFALSVAVLFFCHRLKIPSIVGFVFTGLLAGPYGLGLIKSIHEVNTLAEIGIVLLLFTIGLEFSFKDLLRIKKTVLLGGTLQVTLTFLGTFFIVRQLGWQIGQAIFIGFLVSLSSTAIVLKVFQERAEIDSPHGRTSLGILIFQDIIMVPMILVAPLIAGEMGDLSESILILLSKGIGIILLVIVCARWVVPWVLYQVVKTRSREIFLLSIVLICMAIAWLTSSAGLSLALGAFLAGLVISESEYSHQALGNTLPFRDVFISFFFVSIGMLLDISFFVENLWIIMLVFLSVILLKTMIAGMATILLGFPLRTAILVGFAISQVGEFSFILSKTGLEFDLLNETIYQIFLSVSVLTMASTPFLMALSPKIADLILRIPMPVKLRSGFIMIQSKGRKEIKDHIVIIGFGVNGRNLARAAKVGGIPYVIIEMNPDVVRKERAKGEAIYYGDATQEAILHQAFIKDARIVVIAISYPAATRRIIEVSRRLSSKVCIIARTPYLQELKPLYKLGADEVISEEFEASVEIFSRVLRKYLIPRDKIARFMSEVRSDGYEMFRSLSEEEIFFSDLKLHVPNIEISTLQVAAKSSSIGKSLAQIDLRKNFGVTVLAIRRDLQILSNPSADMQLMESDTLYILSKPEKIADILNLFDNPENSSKT